MSVITDIADAVTASLNAGTFTETFTAERLHEARVRADTPADG